jgi:hypothetical protein
MHDGVEVKTMLYIRAIQQPLERPRIYQCCLNSPYNAAGNQLYVTDLDTASAGVVKVGSMICADREYPETPRMLAEMGAEVLLVSNAWDLTDWPLAMFRTRHSAPPPPLSAMDSEINFRCLSAMLRTSALSRSAPWLLLSAPSMKTLVTGAAIKP